MKNEPSQTVIKELSPESNCIIYGEIKSILPINGILAVAAISHKYGKQDIVASSFLCEKGSAKALDVVFDSAKKKMWQI